MQITRQRMRPEVNINTAQKIVLACSGTGKVTSTLLLEDEIEKKIALFIYYMVITTILSLLVHPIVYSHLTKGFFTSILLKRWKKKTCTKA
jgi:ribonuclease G